MTPRPTQAPRKLANPHLRRLALLKPYWRRLLVGLVALLLSVAIELVYPKAVAYFVDHLTVEHDSAWLRRVMPLALAVLTVQAVATGLRYYILTSTGAMVVTDLREQLYKKLVSQSVGFFDRHGVGELANRLAADVESLREILSVTMSTSLKALATFVGGSVMLLMLSPALSLLTLGTLPVAIWSAQRLGRIVQKRSMARQEKQADCGQVAQEVFSNIRLVHAFGQERREQARYSTATRAALGYLLSYTRLFAGFQGVGALIQGVIVIAILWFGGRLIEQGQLTVGGLTSFILYTVMVASAMATLSSLWRDWMVSVGATERVFDILAAAPERAVSDGRPVPSLAGDVAFEHVTFSYPARPGHVALKDFSLKVAAGEKVALVGPSGAGKSTVVALLVGFYQPGRGTIRFDGADARDLRLADIRRHIAIVEQEPVLFSGTIRDNIRYAVPPEADISDADIIAAAKAANAHEFISGFPDGYDTRVGNRGTQLSGGQKQRIAIARAMLRDPKILILDEATSALDAENEKQVQTALERLMAGRTTIIIAHRFSTIAGADRLVVMADGQMVQNDSHTRLIEDTEGLYFRLVQSQMGACMMA